MAKINFTAARVAAHMCHEGKSQSFLWDSRAPGLGLRATANGSKSYIFQSKLNGATVRVTVGDALNWTIEQAQERARELQSSFFDRGIDPREHALKERAADDARKAEARRQDARFGDAWGPICTHANRAGASGIIKTMFSTPTKAASPGSADKG